MAPLSSSHDEEAYVNFRAAVCLRLRWLIAVAWSLAIAGVAPAQQPVTARSVVPALDKLKQTYEVRNFRIGGKYNLDADPETWRDGGEGGTTLESLGAGPLKVAYIAVGTPQKNDRGEITNAVIISTGNRDRSAALSPIYGPDCCVLSTANEGAIRVHITPNGDLTSHGYLDAHRDPCRE